MTGTDDLSDLFVPRVPPAVRYSAGILRGWDPNTKENVVRWRGVTLRNLGVMSSVDPTSIAGGDTVFMLGLDDGGRGGNTEWVIMGKIIVPDGPASGASLSEGE